jgi:hypothetical protein
MGAQKTNTQSNQRKKMKITNSIKSFVSVFAVLTSTFIGSSQGFVNFNNRVAGVHVSHVFLGGESQLRGYYAADLPSGTSFPTNGLTLMGGSGYWTSLLGAPGADQAEGTLLAGLLGSPVAGSGGYATSFRTGAAAGFIAGSIATFSNIPADAPVATFEMVAWDNSSGLYSTWALAYPAWQEDLINGGTSGTFNIQNIGGVVNSAPVLTDLLTFNLHFGMPEPSTAALATLGALCLVSRRLRTGRGVKKTISGTFPALPVEPDKTRSSILPNN